MNRREFLISSAAAAAAASVLPSPTVMSPYVPLNTSPMLAGVDSWSSWTGRGLGDKVPRLIDCGFNYHHRKQDGAPVEPLTLDVPDGACVVEQHRP